jgi:uncharacterized protein with ACT and thioredoxin-like domain
MDQSISYVTPYYIRKGDRHKIRGDPVSIATINKR